MDLITLDFETYYDKQYSLRKMTTEEYIRDERFEAIGVGVKVNDGETEWASGSHKQLKQYLHKYFDWGNAMVLAHNNMFDGAILSWVFDIHPKALADTLSMARALHGTEVRGSLAFLADMYGIGKKGTEVIDAMGLRRLDFSDSQLSEYGDYCVNDVELCYQLFEIFINKGFPQSELKVIDTVLRMFTEPVLELDEELLVDHLADVRQRKEALLDKAGLERDVLMSNPKFADLLREYGVEPPMKTSPTTGKETYAFAKSDKAFTDLQEHDSLEVQALMAARLGVKSTIEETRTERFINISTRGPLPVPIKYYAAHTGRFGGDDKINLQNLRSRGESDSKTLKRSMMAPPGYVLIDSDSSQIEARVLAWLAEQDDLVDAFFNGEDVYKEMAADIYNKPVSEIDKGERFVGKSTILGCGYSMGGPRFKEQLRTTGGVNIELDEAKEIIYVYRDKYWKIPHLWRAAQNALIEMYNGNSGSFGRDGIIKYSPEGIELPNGLMIRYDDLQAEETDRGLQFTYKTRKGRTRIYGGKVVENICQALARIIITDQMLRIVKRYRILLTVHDSLLALAKAGEATEARAYVEKCMRYVPKWAKGVPLDCESGVNIRYGDC